WPDRQNIVLATAVLEKNGVTNATVTALPISRHISALEKGQVDALYTLEPTGTVGRLNGTTRVLEPAIVAKYVLGDAKAAWLNGAAVLSAEFTRDHPAETKKYLAAYRRGVEFVRKEPAEARQYFKNYTTLDARVAAEVPLSAYTMYDELKASDIAMLQKS